MIGIIGIGSPFGDDAAGLVVARRLIAMPPPGTRIVAADRADVSVIDYFDGASAVVVIDAARSGAPLGTLHDFDLCAPLPLEVRFISSHTLGMGVVLALARSLGRSPAQGRILGIEAGGAVPGTGLSPAVRAAVGQAVTRVRRWCAAYAACV